MGDLVLERPGRRGEKTPATQEDGRGHMRVRPTSSLTGRSIIFRQVFWLSDHPANRAFPPRMAAVALCDPCPRLQRRARNGF